MPNQQVMVKFEVCYFHSKCVSSDCKGIYETRAGSQTVAFSCS